MKQITVYLVKAFVNKKRRGSVENLKKRLEKLCDSVETVNKFSYLDDRLNTTGGFETAVTPRTKIWLNKVQ